MGLNESYKIIRGQIQMMQPLPSLSTAYSLIIQEERQRTIIASSFVNIEAIAMHVSSDSSPNSVKKTLTCTHCKKTGHKKSQCYRLVGFPSNFKFTKAKKEESKSNVHNTTSFPFTSEQYQQLLQLLNNNTSQPSTSHVNDSIADNAMNPKELHDWSA
ncbi:uncharacterized protein LOC122194592 [Lactuca sativa]|uniref:uncharacterized protein LOC122194592 n=1 Tax=Lactuca sativa TaxID=4236 RepID=UPI001C689C5F|nr:uncharacterized protein LOC122194592 [Lactuca sativa]